MKCCVSVSFSAHISPGHNGERDVSPVFNLIYPKRSQPADVCYQYWIIDVCFRGETALHKAASSCQRSICHYLVEAGASLMKTDLQVNQSPALELFLQSKCTSIMKMWHCCRVITYVPNSSLDVWTLLFSPDYCSESGQKPSVFDFQRNTRQQQLPAVWGRFVSRSQAQWRPPARAVPAHFKWISSTVWPTSIKWLMLCVTEKRSPAGSPASLRRTQRPRLTVAMVKPVVTGRSP